MKPISATLIPVDHPVFVIRDSGIARGRIIAPATSFLNEAFVHVKLAGRIETVQAGRVFLEDADARTAFNILADRRPS